MRNWLLILLLVSLIFIFCDEKVTEPEEEDIGGTEEWIFETQNDIRSSPAIASDGTIYVGSGDGRPYAVPMMTPYTL